MGVTDYCEVGAPAGAVRVGGTKNPRVADIVAAKPDVVVANAEENRPDDIDELRAAGVDVVVTFPKTVADVEGLLVTLAELAGSDASPAVADLRAAIADAEAIRPRTPVAALTLVWRKPLMGLGPDTYADDLLRTCGFANVLAGWDERYPKLDVGLHLGPQVVVLPSEPYAFTADDRDAVRELAGDAQQQLVDGRLLTWHGTLTADALRTFSGLAAQLAGG